MTMPGFSAESSLYKSSIDYRSTGALVQLNPDTSLYMSIEQYGRLPCPAPLVRCGRLCCEACDPFTNTCCPPERTCGVLCLGPGYSCCKNRLGEISAICKPGDQCCRGYGDESTCYTPLAGETCCQPSGAVCDIEKYCCNGTCIPLGTPCFCPPGEKPCGNLGCVPENRVCCEAVHNPGYFFLCADPVNCPNPECCGDGCCCKQGQCTGAPNYGCLTTPNRID